MARRRANTTEKRVGWSPKTDFNGLEAQDPKNDKQEARFADPDVERHSAAVRAIRGVEIEHLLTELRLFRSHFNEEHLQTPLFHFLKEILPNLSVSRNEEDRLTEVQWIGKDGKVSMISGSDLLGSLLHQLSILYADCSAVNPSFRGFEFSSKAVQTSLLDYLNVRDFVTSQRLFNGMESKAQRFPKPGEMLYSVHGSPIGVYREDNMEAIQGE